MPLLGEHSVSRFPSRRLARISLRCRLQYRSQWGRPGGLAALEIDRRGGETRHLPPPPSVVVVQKAERRVGSRPAMAPRGE